MSPVVAWGGGELRFRFRSITVEEAIDREAIEKKLISSDEVRVLLGEEVFLDAEVWSVSVESI